MKPTTSVFLAAIVVCAFHSMAALAKSPESILERLEHPPLVAAHRGGAFGLQNSLTQFGADMMNEDADILEMDLRLTLDGQVVVFHDDTLDQKSDCSGTVESKRYLELMQCKLDDGERIPLFDDVLELVEGDKLISAEPKTDSAVIPVARLILANHAENWVFLQTSVSELHYRLVREVSPELAVMVKVDSPESWQRVLAANDPFIKIVELDRDYANPALIADIHRRDKLVSMNSWRYQFSEERFVASCDRVFEQGIDIAVTNNSHSCEAQEPAWNSRGSDPGQVLDRQHVRRWVRQHPSEAVAALWSLLAVALSVSVGQRIYRRRSADAVWKRLTGIALAA